MPCLSKLDTFDPKTGFANVIIETPQGSRNKNKYDTRTRLFMVNSLLPAGCVFPFDFGFLPSTTGEDGDPLDVLVLMEVAAPAGFLVRARVIGVIEAEQTEEGTTQRNDRLIAVSQESHRHRDVESLKDLEKHVLEEVTNFFISYNKAHGKKFKPLGQYGPGRALKLIKEGQDRFETQKDGDGESEKKGKKKTVKKK